MLIIKVSQCDKCKKIVVQKSEKEEELTLTDYYGELCGDCLEKYREKYRKEMEGRNGGM